MRAFILYKYIHVYEMFHVTLINKVPGLLLKKPTGLTIVLFTYILPTGTSVRNRQFHHHHVHLYTCI